MAEMDVKVYNRRRELDKMQTNLEQLKETRKNLEVEIRLVKEDIERCSVRKERAAKLLSGLGGER